MKSSTKALARQVRDALLALPDEALVKTTEQWGALLKQMTAGDFDILEEALLACGLHSYSDIPAEECFSSIYQRLKRSCNNSAISISTRSNRPTEQNTSNIALYKVILRTV